MASKEDVESNSLDVAVEELPDDLTEYVKTKVAEYIAQAKDVKAKIHHVKGQQPKLVLTFGENQGDKERQLLTETNAETVKNNTILVTNLPTIIDEDVLEIFFESTKKQGGGPVKNVKIISNKNIAIVEFYEESSVDTVLKKIPISFGKSELGIVPFNPVLKADETTYRVYFKGVYMPNEFSESLLENQLQLNGPAMAAMMKVSMRVVRGKDWKYGDQDKGGMGTVTYVPENINKDWVKVKWDHGTETHYKMGVDNSYELKLVETHNSVQQDTE